MDIIALLNSLVAQLQALQLQLQDAQAAVESVAKENYDKGFEDGKKSVEGKIYSQEELDQAIALAVGPLQSEIENLKIEIESLKGQMDSAKELGRQEMKAELKVAFEAQQASESSSESGFGDLLK